MSILTGIFTWLKGDDAENRRRLEETKKSTDSQYTALAGLASAAWEQRTEHDREASEDAASAKAECDEFDIDELVDIGNAMLADRGALRDS
jgi:hypothetical protein